jgi:hypothetical protein
MSCRIALVRITNFAGIVFSVKILRSSFLRACPELIEGTNGGELKSFEILRLLNVVEA